jgi:hypothetical protein
VILFGVLAVVGLISLGVGLLIALHDEKKVNRAREQAWEKERRDLLNRIQVPEAAPFMTDETTEIPVQHVAFDDDEEFHEAMEEAGRI